MLRLEPSHCGTSGRVEYPGITDIWIFYLPIFDGRADMGLRHTQEQLSSPALFEVSGRLDPVTWLGVCEVSFVLPHGCG